MSDADLRYAVKSLKLLSVQVSLRTDCANHHERHPPLMTSPQISQLPEFTALKQHAEQARLWQLSQLFEKEPARCAQFSLEAAGLYADFSKNHLQRDTLTLLTAYARARKLEAQRDAMFRGDRINLTENRAVLHTLLRAPKETRLICEGQELMGLVQAVLDRIELFTARVRSGDWKGYTGKAITDVVNIGIGGSDLGPAMTCTALRPYGLQGPRMHFLSNVDGHAVQATLRELDAQTTLFIIASKSFTTQETMMNAKVARDWFLRHATTPDIAKHFVAVSTQAEAVAAFGIDTENMFPFWDWVGGRYSIWSAIGLPLAIAIGMENFRSFLAGAYAMDRHFQEAPLENNMPVLLALTGFWYREFFGTASHLIAPYHQDLQMFPAYLQQLEMESNGKQITKEGQHVSTATAPVIWGSVGTNGQHAYFQLLHQGTDRIPVDFIAALKPAHELIQQHKVLLANCFAQAEALMQGKVAEDGDPSYRRFSGNHPSTMLLMDELTPTSLGALIALYEHKTFVQGVLWDINSFDQWGVELGKVLANKILAELNGAAANHSHDSSTANLIARASAALK